MQAPKLNESGFGPAESVSGLLAEPRPFSG